MPQATKSLTVILLVMSESRIRVTQIYVGPRLIEGFSPLILCNLPGSAEREAWLASLLNQAIGDTKGRVVLQPLTIPSKAEAMTSLLSGVGNYRQPNDNVTVLPCHIHDQPDGGCDESERVESSRVLCRIAARAYGLCHPRPNLFLEEETMRRLEAHIRDQLLGGTKRRKWGRTGA